ncbi:MAG: hypothetical protein ACC726_06335 [Chloroflexota bacterium]
MPRSSRVLASAAVAALAITALGAPAAAEPPLETSVTVVQGFPGRIDVCIGGKEVASNLRFGKSLTTIIEPGRLRVKVFKADARKCRGRLIVTRRVLLEQGSDTTFAVKKQRPNLLVFRNMFMATPDVDELELMWVPFALRHAARARDTEMTMGIGIDVPPNEEIVPLSNGSIFDAPWGPGDELIVPVPDILDVFMSARNASTNKRLLDARVIDIKPTKRYEVYLVGYRNNYRWVVVKKPFEALPF